MEDPHKKSPRIIKNTPKKNSFWRKLGGGSLTVSIILHAILLVLAAIWIIRIIPPAKEKTVDFMPNGGGGGNPASHERSMQKQKAAIMKPNAARIAVAGVTSQISLPELDSSSSLSSLGSISGGMSGGLGGSGSGGGRGDGQGRGFGSGNGLGVAGGLGNKPIFMFGTELLETKKIGVVIDVSMSMTPYLANVLGELDKVAAGSPVVLARGCMVSDIKPPDRIRPANGSKLSEQRFEEFWRFSQSNKTPDMKGPMPRDSEYKIVGKRLNTFYLPTKIPGGLVSCSEALTARELKECDTIYWFADFQDEATAEAMEDVLKTLLRNKQKLYMHASIKGKSLEKLKSGLIEPSGGKVIRTKVKKNES